MISRRACKWISMIFVFVVVLAVSSLVPLGYRWHAASGLLDEVAKGPGKDELSRSQQDVLAGYLRGSFACRPPWRGLDAHDRKELIDASYERIAAGQENVFRVIVLQHEEGVLDWPEFRESVIEYVNSCNRGSGKALQLAHNHLGVPSLDNIDLDGIVENCRRSGLWASLLVIYDHSQLADRNDAFQVFAEADSAKDVQQALADIISK